MLDGIARVGEMCLALACVLLSGEILIWFVVLGGRQGEQRACFCVCCLSSCTC